MANIVSNLNIKPYYDTTEAELEKGYSQFLAVEDRVLQNRELNVMQGLIKGNIRKVTDIFIDNSSIVSGCSFKKLNDVSQCILTPGEVYFDGNIINIEQHVWDFTEVPTEESDVYLEIYMTTIDEIEDPSLYDPAEVYENHGQPGGHRLKYLAIPKIATKSEFKEISLTKRNIVHLMQIFNRELYGPLKPKPIFGKMYSMLAKRTYDSMGDFLSNGLTISTTRSDSAANMFYTINISPGKAYIKGFEFLYQNSTKVIFKAATDTKSCGLTHSVGPDMNTYVNSVNRYKLSRNNVKSIDHVNGLIANSGITLTYDPITRVNNLPSHISSIYSIDEVYDYSGPGSSKKVYELAVDYSIESSNTSIIWTTTGSHPVGAFYVDITISKEIDQEFYQLLNENNESFIQFSDSGIKPKNDTTFSTSYTWFLSRIDLVYMTQDGFIKIKAGIPNEISNISKPSIPLHALPLAYITVNPKVLPENYSIDSFDIYRVPVIQLQTMKKKINDFEYNFAMNELEKLAQNAHIERESLITLRNIFADSISGYDKADFGNREHDSTINLYKSEVTLPYNIDHLTRDDVIVYDENDNIINEDFSPTTLPIIGNEIIGSQDKVTHHKDIAPYIFKAMLPEVIVKPKKLVHINENYIARTIWLPNRIVYESSIVEKWTTEHRSVTVRGQQNRTFTTTTNSVRDVYVDDITIIGEELVDVKIDHINTVPQPFIFEPSYVLVTGKNFLPNTEIRIIFDDTSVLVPEFVDTIFEEVEYSYFGERNVISVTSLPPTSAQPLLEPTWQNVLESVPRPTTWRWNKIAENEYLIEHATIENDGMQYKYNIFNKKWFYKYLDQEEFIELSSAPLFLKWVTRSPWFNDSVEEIENESLKQEIIDLNVFEPITNIRLDKHSDMKTAAITDVFGYFQALVQLPPNTEMGLHTIKCVPAVSGDFDIDEHYHDEDVFSAESYIRNWDEQFYRRRIEQIETILYRTYVTTITTTRVVCHSDCHSNSGGGGRAARGDDPLAQTFVFDRTMYLTGIDLFFAAKSPDVRSMVFFDIRETSDNGFPTGKTIYSQSINRNSILVGDDYPATHIEFTHPVFIKANVEYAFVVGASINGYKLFYAKMAHNDLITGEPVLYNPIVSGVMLESSNNKTWSAIQDSDIKYALYRSVFDTEPKSYIIKNINKAGKYTNQNFAISNITLPNIVFEFTDIVFEQKISNNNVFTNDKWDTLKLEERYNYLPTTENITNMNHSIKVTLKTENDFLSPVVNFGGFEAFYGKYKNRGSYIQIPLTLD